MKKLLSFLILPLLAMIGLQAQTDVTNTYLLNPSFESATSVSTTIEHWTNLNSVFQSQSNTSFGKKDGTWYAEKWQSSGNLTNLKLSQQVAAIPNGKYLLKAAAFTNNNFGGAFVFANDKKTEVFNTNDYSVIVEVTTGTLDVGFEVVKSSNWVACDNFRLYSLENNPYLEVNTTVLKFDVAKKEKTFIVKGTNFTSNLTLTAPAGITLSKNSLTPAEVEAGITITATYDGLTNITEGSISVTGGAASQSILVTASAADAACYSPLYTDRPNLIPDPLLTDLANFGGWGNKSIVTDYVYCGTTAGKITDVGGGSIDVGLTGKLKPNTNYRVKVMVSTNGTGEAQIGVDRAAAALIENKFSTAAGEWIALDFAFTTRATLVDPLMYINNYALTSSEVYIDNWEMYELFDAPTLAVNPISLVFDALNPIRQFEIVGANLVQDITITPPAGITVDINSVSSADSYDGVTITAEYDFSAKIIDGVIDIKSGSASAKVSVNAFNDAEGTCFEPFYPEKENLIKDPFLNSLSTYAGWGNREIVTDARAYCFSSVFVSGKCGGSLDYHLTGIIKPYTTYRVRAMVSSNGTGTGKIGISGAGIPNVYQPFETEAGQYKLLDFTFTTGANISGPNMYLNSCESETATELYIDNFEMYELNDPTLVIDPMALSFDPMHLVDSVTVAGQNLTENIVLTLPTGITADLTTITPEAAAAGVKVKFTYDGSIDVIDGEVNATSGALTKKLIINASKYLINGSFERPIAEGWVNVGDMVRQGNNSFPLKSGNQYVEKWTNSGGTLSSLDLSQTILGIPNGDYTVKASAQAVQQADNTHPGGAYIIANEKGVEVIETAEYAIDVTVVDETLKVGFQVTQTGNWVAVDNFKVISKSAQGLQKRHALDGVNAFVMNNRIHADINLDKNSLTTVTVYNVNGMKLAEKEVALQAGMNRVMIDNEFAKGVYLVEVVADGKFAAFKLIK